MITSFYVEASRNNRNEKLGLRNQNCQSMRYGYTIGTYLSSDIFHVKSLPKRKLKYVK